MNELEDFHEELYNEVTNGAVVNNDFYQHQLEKICGYRCKILAKFCSFVCSIPFKFTTPPLLKPLLSKGFLIFKIF